MRSRLVLAAAVSFVLGVFIGAAALSHAQTTRPSDPRTVIITTDSAGTIIRSSPDNPPIVNDLGLRVTGQHGRRVVGTLMAKVNGMWTEVQLAPQDSFATQH